MKKYTLIAFSFLLFACNTPIEKPASTNPETESNIETEVLKDKIQGQPVETVGVGRVCGGNARVSCKSGLRCNLDPTSTDESGICEDTVVDKTLECPATQKPVCALLNDNKNAYLNECQAKRHGAEVLYEGFCKSDETVVGNCSAKVLGLEGCIKNVKGFMFDGTTCIEKVVQGCRAETPFESLAACNTSCMGTTTLFEKIKGCPDEKIINKMPMIGTSNIPKEYFIYQGIRQEINTFDKAYLQENCDIKETVVQ